MAKNPILEELYEVRSQILAEHGNDLRTYLDAAFERLKASGHPIAKIKQRRICRKDPANAVELAESANPQG